jgi:hypothetical protein
MKIHGVSGQAASAVASRSTWRENVAVPSRGSHRADHEVYRSSRLPRVSVTHVRLTRSPSHGTPGAAGEDPEGWAAIAEESESP